MKKRIFTLALAIILVLSMSITAFAATTVPHSGVILSEVTSNSLVRYNGHYFNNGGGVHGGMTAKTTVMLYNVPVGATADISGVGYDERSGELVIYAYTLINGEVDELREATSGFSVSGKIIKFNNAGIYGILTDKGETFINVGGSGSGSSATAASGSQAVTAISSPANANTVKVAGQDRTPGQIFTYGSSGYLYTVNHGDTLYKLAERFYGNGNLWPELQKANQTWLNDTKDGIIFVGFNLLVPNTIGNVGANIR